MDAGESILFSIFKPHSTSPNLRLTSLSSERKSKQQKILNTTGVKKASQKTGKSNKRGKDDPVQHMKFKFFFG